MKDGVCPKCKSNEVYFRTPPRTDANSVIYIRLMVEARLTYYVCTNCGYVEQYIEEPGKLQRIAETWTKFGSAPTTQKLPPLSDNAPDDPTR